jgi:hypothetical protein
MADCTFTDEEEEIIDGADKWSSFQQSDLLRFQLVAMIERAGLTIGEGCEFSEDELALIDSSQKWSSYQPSELLAIMLAALAEIA